MAKCYLTKSGKLFRCPEMKTAANIPCFKGLRPAITLVSRLTVIQFQNLHPVLRDYDFFVPIPDTT